MGEVIVITSGKGGVGKTTTTANVAVALAGLGKKVIGIDLDLGLRNLDVALGLDEKIVYDVVDVLEQKCRLRQALVKHETEGVTLLAASQTRDADALDPEKLMRLLKELKETFDYVLIDCPAGIGRGFENALAGADGAIVVTVPQVAAVRDADRVIMRLMEKGIENPRLLINRMRPDLTKKGVFLRIEEILEWLSIPLLGVVPEDEAVFLGGILGSIAKQKDGSRAAEAFSNVARRLIGEQVPVIDLTKKKRRLFRKKKV